jgi:outer membrane lipoprotein LolB
MRRFPWAKCGWVALLLLLNGCSGVTIKEPGAPGQQAYQERASELATIDQWGLSGKLSLDDGDDGGSGKLNWDTGPEGYDLDFRGAMGRGAWQLQVREHSATLREADGSVQTAAGVAVLMQQRIGWSVPVEALAWWVRGLKAPDPSGLEQFDSEGRLLSLQQFGWSIEFRRYRSIDGFALPVRLEAQRDNYRVKLAVGRWRLGPG